eukprot:757151-Hanusia_phi.AAC.3
MGGIRPTWRGWKLKTLIWFSLWLYLCCDGLLLERMRGGMARAARSTAPKGLARVLKPKADKMEVVVTKRKQSMKPRPVKRKAVESSILLDMSFTTSESHHSESEIPNLNFSADDSLWSSNGRRRLAAPKEEEEEDPLERFDHLQAAQLNATVKRQRTDKGNQTSRAPPRARALLAGAQTQGRTRSPQKRRPESKSKLSTAEQLVMMPQDLCWGALTRWQSTRDQRYAPVRVGADCTPQVQRSSQVSLVSEFAASQNSGSSLVNRAEQLYASSISLNQSDPTVYYWSSPSLPPPSSHHLPPSHSNFCLFVASDRLNRYSRCFLDQFELTANATKLSLALHYVKRSAEQNCSATTLT